MSTETVVVHNHNQVANQLSCVIATDRLTRWQRVRLAWAMLLGQEITITGNAVRSIRAENCKEA